MANKEHLAILKQGVEAWNQWRQENPAIKPNLRAANLSEMNLAGIDLHHSNLSRSNLTAANLAGARLYRANLRGANFRGANLSEVDFLGVDFQGVDLQKANLKGAILKLSYLSDANLQGAYLVEADLSSANLTRTMLRNVELQGANLSNAKLYQTVFADVDLSQTHGLELVQHEGPSTIGIDTIYKSNGNIPETFLRGAGIPETFIAQIPSLVRATQPLQFYSCFISYSTKDQTFANRLYDSLRKAGVRSWFMPESLKTGAKIQQMVDEAIRIQDKVLVVISKNSVTNSWVETEVELALARESTEKRTVLFPICIDDALFKSQEGWANIIRTTRALADFRQWLDNIAYQKALSRLLRDLTVTFEQEKDG